MYQEVRATRERETEPLRRLPWGIRDVAVALIAVFFAFCVTVGVTVGLFIALDLSERGRIVAGLATNAGLEIMAVLIVLHIVVRWRHGGFGDLGFRPFPVSRLWWVGGFFLAAYAILVAYFAIVQGLGITWLEPRQQVPEGTFDSTLSVAVAAMAVVAVAPFTEELFFRGFIFAGLAGRVGVPAAAVVSGLLFSLVHGQPGLVLPFTLIGVLLAYVYYKSGSLWVSILAHLVYNGVAFAVMNAVEGVG